MLIIIVFSSGGNIYLPVGYPYLSILSDDGADIFCSFSVNIELQFFISNLIIILNNDMLYSL